MSAGAMPEPDQAFRLLAERFAAGTLAGSEREEFRRRLAQEPMLERYVTGILSTDAALRDIIPIIARQQAAPVGGRAGPRPGRRPLRLLAWSGALAAAALLVAILVAHAAARSAAAGDARAIASGTRLHLGAHETRLLACPDGSRLGLEDGAEMAFTEDAQGMRIDLRAGALSAEVRTQPAGRPLRIAAPQAELTVVGTSFHVATGGERTRLEVAHGSVRFAAHGGSGAFLVGAGEYASAGDRPDATLKGIVRGTLPPASALRPPLRAIVCGLGTGVAYAGVQYEADRYFEGGRVVPWLQARLPDNPLLAAGRCGTFRYAIPLADGRYALTLRLHEPDPQAVPGRRVFTIDVQGQRIWEHLDIAAAVGAGPLLDLTSLVDVRHGMLDLRCFADHAADGDDASPLIAAIVIRAVAP